MEVSLYDLVFDEWGTMVCLRCGSKLSSKVKKIRQHYREEHGDHFLIPNKQTWAKNPDQEMESSVKLEDTELKKEDLITSADHEFQQRPVTEFFRALQTAFELLRPQTQQEMTKRLTLAVMDALYKDKVAEGDTNPDECP